MTFGSLIKLVLVLDMVFISDDQPIHRQSSTTLLSLFKSRSSATSVLWDSKYSSFPSIFPRNWLHFGLEFHSSDGEPSPIRISRRGGAHSNDRWGHLFTKRWDGDRDFLTMFVKSTSPWPDGWSLPRTTRFIWTGRLTIGIMISSWIKSIRFFCKWDVASVG